MLIRRRPIGCRAGRAGSDRGGVRRGPCCTGRDSGASLGASMGRGSRAAKGRVSRAAFGRGSRGAIGRVSRARGRSGHPRGRGGHARGRGSGARGGGRRDDGSAAMRVSEGSRRPRIMRGVLPCPRVSKPLQVADFRDRIAATCAPIDPRRQRSVPGPASGAANHTHVGTALRTAGHVRAFVTWRTHVGRRATFARRLLEPEPDALRAAFEAVHHDRYGHSDAEQTLSLSRSFKALGY